MTPNEIARHIAERAMTRHKLGARELAKAIGCGDHAVYQILNEQPVRMTQEQWFNLMSLGRKQNA